jgi:hypothetical protein
MILNKILLCSNPQILDLTLKKKEFIQCPVFFSKYNKTLLRSNMQIFDRSKTRKKHLLKINSITG